MLEKYFKNASEKFAKPFIKICISLKIQPNTLSIIGIFVVIVGSIYFLTENKNIGINLIFLGSAVDGLDGPLARNLNKTSDKGAVLDSTIDRIGELFIWAVIGIKFTHSNIELFTIFSIVTSSGLIPYIRAKSEGKTSVLHTLNGTAIAVGRILIALIENNQTEDGKVEFSDAVAEIIGVKNLG